MKKKTPFQNITVSPTDDGIKISDVEKIFSNEIESSKEKKQEGDLVGTFRGIDIFVDPELPPDYYCIRCGINFYRVLQEGGTK